MSDDTTAVTGGTSRRTVIRNAAHAAWAVPAIQIAAAAPAFAAVSKNDAYLARGGTAVTGPTNKNFKVSDLFVVNDGPRPANVTITLQLTADQGKLSLVPTEGWSVVSGSDTSVINLSYTGVVPVVGTAPHEYMITGPTVLSASSNTKTVSVTSGPTFNATYNA